MKDLMISLLKVAGITFLRFRPVPRVWSIWLATVNRSCLFYLQHVEAQVVLGVSLAAVLLQAAIHRRIGFVRLLGAAHAFWIPMFAWLATRTGEIAAYPDLQLWLVVLALTNAISLVVDGIDLTRFARGERQPHYSWN